MMAFPIKIDSGFNHLYRDAIKSSNYSKTAEEEILRRLEVMGEVYSRDSKYRDYFRNVPYSRHSKDIANAIDQNTGVGFPFLETSYWLNVSNLKKIQTILASDGQPCPVCRRLNSPQVNNKTVKTYHSL